MFTSFFKSKQSFFLVTAIVLFITFLSYSNIFQNEFIGDDLDFISNWSTTHNLSGLSKLLSGDLPPVHVGTYRPVRSLFYLLTYQLWAGNIFYYHLFSISIHLFATFLIIINTKVLTKNNWLALSSGLLFGLHPIHTEAITFITASFDTLAFVFLLTSFYFYQHYKNTKKSLQLSLSMVFAAISFFTNEQTLIFPLIIASYEYLFGKLNKKTGKQIAPFFAIAGLFIFVRFGLLKIITRGDSQFPTLLSSLITSLKALLKYYQTLIYPYDLNIAHNLWSNVSTYTFPELNKTALLAQKITEIPVLISVLITIAIIFTIYKLKKNYPLISFSLFWLIISFLPVLNLLPASLIYAERYAYLPSVGFVLLVTSSFFYATQKFKINHLKIILLSILLLTTLSIFYFYKTYTRNADWQSEVTFWNSAVSANQNNPTVYFQLGQVHHVRSNWIEAKAAYQKTIEIEPRFTKAYYNLAMISESEQNLDNAVNYYGQALELDPANRGVRQKLAGLYTLEADMAKKAKEFTRAYAMYTQAISLDPSYLDAITKRNNLCQQTPQYCK